jgi:hypothetical protein
MKKLLFFSLLTISSFLLYAQADKASLLQDLEGNQLADQNVSATATLKSASRLFGEKDDLTTVILVIPSGSTVNVLGSDSTYFHVIYNNEEGYILKRHAVLDKVPVKTEQPSLPKVIAQQSEPKAEKQVESEQDREMSRFSYLENKYGSGMAARLISGKIWKGMNAEMVKDSWGTAQKINRVINGNVIKEEWIFKNTWLYFENNTLLEWGPIKN